MNRKLFHAIIVTGAALGACRSGLLPEGGVRDLALGDLALADLSRRDQALVDLARPIDLARPVDMAGGDLKECCTFGPNDPADLSGCIPVECILIF
jgi:hypothetical protein